MKERKADQGSGGGRSKVMPREDTQFKPGKSGNPSGRAKGFAEFSDTCRRVSHEGIARVLDIVRNHPDPSIQLAAWKVLFDRAWAKPVAPVAVNLEADVQHSFVVVAPAPILSGEAWGGGPREDC
jgi:hypothetical protein